MDYIVGINQHVSAFPLRHESLYLTTYSFEKNFDTFKVYEWCSTNFAVSIGVAILYVLGIFWLQRYMKDKKSFDLRPALIVWNSCLALFSVTTFVRLLPELVTTLSGDSGFHNSLCHWTRHTYTTSFWLTMFTFSKLLEFGDTIFLVLRKKKLIFLHWYHHVMTFFACVIIFADYKTYILWIVVLNSFVHSLMYSYFALSACGVRFPRSWAQKLTTTQIGQFVVGMISILYAPVMRLIYGECDCIDAHPSTVLFLFALACSYIVLFGRFYHNAYVAKAEAKATANNQARNMNGNNKTE